MRFLADDLRRQGWSPPQTFQIPDWCGCSVEYLRVPEGDGSWSLVPIWEPDVTPNRCVVGTHLSHTGRDP